MICVLVTQCMSDYCEMLASQQKALRMYLGLNQGLILEQELAIEVLPHHPS
jgi:hypothetical protein